MVRLQQQFSLTLHAQERMRERFPHLMKDVDIEQTQALRVRKMYQFFWNSTVENRVINDTMFMQFIQDKYGYDKAFKFFVNGEMLFIGVVNPKGNAIVTVVDRTYYASRHLRPTTQKFKKKPNTFRGRKRIYDEEALSSKAIRFQERKQREHLEIDFDE